METRTNIASPFEKGGLRGIFDGRTMHAGKFSGTVNPSQPPFKKGGAKPHISLTRTINSRVMQCYPPVCAWHVAKKHSNKDE